MTTEEINYEVIRAHESRPEIMASIKTDYKDFTENCPLDEVKCYKIRLHDTDLPRVYILDAPNFLDLTENNSYKLRDVKQTVRDLDRVDHLLKKQIDLSQTDNWAPVFISTYLNTGVLVPIDGNHRLMAHYLLYTSIEGVHGYLFVHPNTVKLTWFPWEIL